MQFLALLAGWRTYLASGATMLLGVAQILVVASTVAGGVTLENGVALSAILLGLSQVSGALAKIFQRMATGTVQQNLAEVSDDVTMIRSLIDQLIKPATPVVPKFPDDPGRPVSSGLIPFALLLLGGSAMATPPTAIINGPKSAEPGEELIFDASMSEGDPTLYAWRVFPQLAGRKQLTVLDGGKKVRLASFPGTYLVRLMVANTEGIADHEHQVTIPGSVPCPPAPTPSPVVPTPVPNPAPGPTPVPVPTPTPVPPPPTPGPVPPVPPIPDTLPAGEFDGLPAAVRVLALLVNSPNRATEAAKLADALEAVAAQAAAKTLTNPLAIVSAIGTAFNGSVPAAWDADFRVKAVSRMKALYEGGKLPTPERWAAMLREVVIGLRSVK